MTSDPAADEVTSVPERFFDGDGKEIRHAGWPFVLRVKKYFANARLGMRPEGDPSPALAASGIGPRISVEEAPPETTADRPEIVAVVVEADPLLSEKPRPPLGTWLLARE